MRAFKQKGFNSAKGLLLPYSEFKLFSDLKNPNINEEKVKRIIKNAEKFLERDIPL